MNPQKRTGYPCDFRLQPPLHLQPVDAAHPPSSFSAACALRRQKNLKTSDRLRKSLSYITPSALSFRKDSPESRINRRIYAITYEYTIQAIAADSEKNSRYLFFFINNCLFSRNLSKINKEPRRNHAFLQSSVFPPLFQRFIYL